MTSNDVSNNNLTIKTSNQTRIEKCITPNRIDLRNLNLKPDELHVARIGQGKKR